MNVNRAAQSEPSIKFRTVSCKLTSFPRRWRFNSPSIPPHKQHQHRNQEVNSHKTNADGNSNAHTRRHCYLHHAKAAPRAFDVSGRERMDTCMQKDATITTTAFTPFCLFPHPPNTLKPKPASLMHKYPASVFAPKGAFRTSLTWTWLVS